MMRAVLFCLLIMPSWAKAQEVPISGSAQWNQSYKTENGHPLDFKDIWFDLHFKNESTAAMVVLKEDWQPDIQAPDDTVRYTIQNFRLPIGNWIFRVRAKRKNINGGWVPSAWAEAVDAVEIRDTSPPTLPFRVKFIVQ